MDAAVEARESLANVLAFAAAMLSSRRLLLLDEPTAGLDVAPRHEIRRWREILAAQGCGIVIGTHDLAAAERCPLILHFAGGRLRVRARRLDRCRSPRRQKLCEPPARATIRARYRRCDQCRIAPKSRMCLAHLQE